MAILSSPLQFVTSTPPATRGLAITTVLLSLTYFWIRWHDTEPLPTTPYLTLVPGASLFYPWTFLTSGFVETSIIELVFSLLVVPASFRYLERLWGTGETLKFIAINTIIPNLISFGLNWIEFLVLRNADLFLYGMEYHGQMALQTAALVAFTQVIPEHQVQVFGVIKVRVKRLPMAYVGLSNVMVIIGYQSPWLNIQWGWLVAWAYLRFYKKNKGDGIVGDSYGDRSETFAFVHWFPPFAHYPVSLICNLVESIFKKLRLLPTPTADVESGGYTLLPGGTRAEAERRRALALKALDQRMAAAVAPPPEPSPAPRPPPAAATNLPNGPPSPVASKTRAVERRTSVSEVDLGESKAKARGKDDA
ncbi:DUF1751-domain-containing protein [Rickenella mellea]|uniref:DUF1751-domain-containing protein n=1 Tax=Rickenella mellea TaxID=50990 RepID=A0A4Y7QLC2_9AGAM|nr:DUF1751-domain-containing protein [Rickenella mellea]